MSVRSAILQPRFPMNKDESMRALDKHQDAIQAHLLKIECKLKDLGAFFVHGLMDTVDSVEQRNGKGILGK